MAAVADPLEVRLLYCPHDPEPPQHAFLLLGDLGVLDAFYGGAAGGGKSDALLMDALRYVDVPGYNAIIFRRTFMDLSLPEALIPRSKEWLAGTDARWNGTEYRWTFPSGATLSFGYLDRENDKYRYQGAAFQFIGFDELTHFREADFKYLFTRARRPSGMVDDHPLAHVPVRIRSASNPGGRGHKWVKRRYIDRLPDPDDPEDTPEKARKRIFIPAKLDDNPHLDAANYREQLAEVDPELRAQMLDGDWDAGGTGNIFARYKHGDYRLAKAIALGREYDRALAAGKLAPPAGGLLILGVDWGEHTGYVVAWPLDAGGVYIVAAAELVAHEPGDAFDVIVDEGLASVAELGRLGDPPRLPAHRDVLELIPDARYDAAGIASMRTFLKKARRRRPRLKSVKVSFGAPMPGASDGRSFKRETIGYFRRLAKRTNEGKTTGIIVIGQAAAEFGRQAQGMNWKDAELGIVEKGDDHVFDAGIAAVAPIARRHRG